MVLPVRVFTKICMVSCMQGGWALGLPCQCPVCELYHCGKELLQGSQRCSLSISLGSAKAMQPAACQISTRYCCKHCSPACSLLSSATDKVPPGDLKPYAVATN